MDRVPVLGLGQRELMTPAVELVEPVLDPVRPRKQNLPAAGRAHLVGAVSVEDVAAVDAVRAEPTADLDDDGALIAEHDLDLLAGRR